DSARVMVRPSGSAWLSGTSTEAHCSVGYLSVPHAFQAGAATRKPRSVSEGPASAVPAVRPPAAMTTAAPHSAAAFLTGPPRRAGGDRGTHGPHRIVPG